ncbi:MAG TPA: hypothetical protein VFW44_15005, partial [Bryobacteraceae bacterium]|nr:hypothetical protein [Bryobacteraceae bacterium]
SGVGPDQVADVRGFADQRLRRPDDPFSASNRRVSIVVKYRAPDDAAVRAAQAKPDSPSGGKAPEAKVSEGKPPEGNAAPEKPSPLGITKPQGVAITPTAPEKPTPPAVPKPPAKHE